MTNKELIEKLSKLDPDLPVLMYEYDAGYMSISFVKELDVAFDKELIGYPYPKIIRISL